MSDPHTGGAAAFEKEMAAALGTGRIPLQRCTACGRAQYPPREVCGFCLDGTLSWHRVEAFGKVVVGSRLHRSLDPELAGHLPASIGLVELEAGPRVLAWLDPKAEERARLIVVADPHGHPVFAAVPADATTHDIDTLDQVK